jgi:GST-like protein
MYRLFARAGWGSAIVEAQLAWHALPFELIEVDDLFQSAEAREALARINPVAQIPTLILPDGTVMTESAAITLHLADVTHDRPLVPAPGDATRPAFLRWLVFIVANIYPTFTYADDPSRFVSEASARAGFKDNVDRHGERLWAMAEAAAGHPWFLGEAMSALDIYIATMRHWRPGPAWFSMETPRLDAIAARADALPELEAIWRRNFPPAA